MLENLHHSALLAAYDVMFYLFKWVFIWWTGMDYWTTRMDHWTTGMHYWTAP